MYIEEFSGFVLQQTPAAYTDDEREPKCFSFSLVLSSHFSMLHHTVLYTSTVCYNQNLQHNKILHFGSVCSHAQL